MQSLTLHQSKSCILLADKSTVQQLDGGRTIFHYLAVQSIQLEHGINSSIDLVTIAELTVPMQAFFTGIARAITFNHPTTCFVSKNDENSRFNIAQAHRGASSEQDHDSPKAYERSFAF